MNKDVACRVDAIWLRAWMQITAKARASQPHFVAPVVTTHAILVQQFRYDISLQQELHRP
jgi:hypothetical protein